jgi:CHASE1-domain containing sensor protein
METLAILGIALIIALITLGVVVVAYKASPAQQAKR